MRSQNALLNFLLAAVLSVPSLGVRQGFWETKKPSFLPSGPFDCLGTKDAHDCDGYDGCSWCNSTNEGTGCYPKQIAKILPKKFFTCDKYPHDDEPAMSATDKIQPYQCYSQNVTQCKDTKETCKWCVSDSGMGSCFPMDTAQYIPFCNKESKVSSSMETKAVHDIQPYQCYSQNATQCKDAEEACKWCVSDSGMGSCFPMETAQYIPFCNKKGASAGFNKELFKLQPAAATANIDRAEELAKNKPSSFACVKQNSSAACDAQEECSWCKTSGLGTGCYPKKVADYLPKSLFTCDKPSDACVKQDTADKCREEKGCSWCTTGGIGTGCYPDNVAKKLPAKFFTCDLDQEADQTGLDEQKDTEVAVLQGGKPSPFDCMHKDTPSACDASDACSWCTSDRKLGTGCYPQKVTKVLPHKFFKCDKKPRALTLEDPKCEKKSEGECVAPSCVWCSSAAVGSACYTPDEAKRLPSAVFSCKTSPSTFASA